MNPFRERLFVCGSERRDEFQVRGISHLVIVANPGAASVKPAWFTGKHLQLFFGDVVSEADARQCRTTAPTTEDLRRALEFFRAAWRAARSKILVSCDYGGSRSPALAYVFIAEALGPGREAEAFRIMLEICPNVLPNGMVVRLGDSVLQRNGALMKPLKELYALINAELSQAKLEHGGRDGWEEPR